MSKTYTDGCRCRRCEANQPHSPVDEMSILRALRNDLPAYPPAKRILAFYDAKRVKPESFGGETRQPWVPVRRAAA